MQTTESASATRSGADISPESERASADPGCVWLIVTDLTCALHLKRQLKNAAGAIIYQLNNL